MNYQFPSMFSVGAWFAPLPNALPVWVDLARRGENAVLDLRHAHITADELIEALAEVNVNSLKVSVALSSADDERLSALRQLAGLQLQVIVPVGSNLPEVSGAEFWCEVTDADAIPEDSESIAHAYVLTGHEAGGAIGEATSFMLLQKARAKTNKPVWVRGGVGPATAAAAIAGGAQGVFIDDGLLLFPELKAPAAMTQSLARLNGSETRLIGENIDAPHRVFTAPRSEAAARADVLDAEVERGDCDANALAGRIAVELGWGEDSIWPVGQGVGFAATLAAKHERVFRLLAATRRSIAKALSAAAEQGALAQGSPLALAQGTHYPLVQGPMTRVSDSPAFAAKVAEGGALPFLALALLRGTQVEAMLAETTRLLGAKPWGVGLLGFIPEALRKEQLAAVAKFQPKFALIAGGRPDQAAEFEKQDVAAWLHVPSPALLRMYIEQGARRFIFEGRECGGHIGPLSSFALWEQMIAILCDDIDADIAGEIEVLFAGGISDAASSAMVAALAAPLVERGIKVGALMGTAYLFTREISETGAVLPEFTEQAIACKRTRNLTTGPGHATRCADTPFATEFLRERQRLSKEGLSAEALRDELEDLNLGRLRLASKGQERDTEGTLVTRDEEAQRRDGMYMIGQVATLHDQALTIAELHRQVCADSQELLHTLAPTRLEEHPETATPADVAVVGINVILPQAHSNDVLWKKLVNLEKTITEVPKERWDSALYFDADKSARDKVYSRWGGFLDDILFDPTQYGIAPNSMRSIDPMQLLSLESTARSLKDAGFPDDFDREHTSIILGAGGGVGELGLQYGVRAEIPRFVEDPDDGVWDRLPEWTNESFAGVLLNVAAGRIANRLNFGGVNFVVDAACGSSLAAITLAVQELTSGRSNVAIAGGVDNVQGPYGFLCFSKTQALSPTGQPRTFDKNADGIAISEGVATVVMKRLADAERDGDRIYAVIKGAAGSSDGKALGMTAPLPAGQKRALRRVYRQAGYGPETLGYVEAHGTGTPVGDRAEAETIVGSLIEHGAAPARTAVGSAKTLVGHTKCAAGVVGLIKSTLALHHRVLPGHYGVSDPIEPFQGPDTPAYLLKKSRPWLRRHDAPRRASVSAFGFGGTNFHATLEEYPDAMAVPGAKDWPQELFVVSAANAAELAKRAADLAQALAGSKTARLSQVTASLVGLVRPNDTAILSFVSPSVVAAVEALHSASAHLTQGGDLAPGIEVNQAVPAEAPKLGFLFPGQGAQAVGRGCESALYLAPLRAAMEKADSALASYLPQPLSEILWPKAAFDDKTQAEQQARLTDTRAAQPALGALASGFYRWLKDLGVHPSACAGHSYGEFVALHAAGAMGEGDMLMLSAERGAAMASAAATAPGAMAAILAAREVVEELIRDIPEAHLANHNSPEQVVITGTVEAVNRVLALAEERSIRAQKLPVSGAFHSPLMAAAQAPLSAAIERVCWQATQVPVYANRDGQPYPSDPAALAKQLDEHLLGPVEFVTQLRQMQADGIQHFVEVGSKSLLAGMVARTLGDSAECFSIDGGAGGLSAALSVLAALYARGVRIHLPALWAGRTDTALARSWTDLLSGLKDREPARTAWLLSGGAARPVADPEYKTGKKPALTAADKAAARERKTERLSQVAQPVMQAVATPTSEPSSVLSAEPASLPLSLASQAPVSPEPIAMDTEAFAAYQETMRSFLELQEKALTMALHGSSTATQMSQVAPPVSTPTPVPVQTVAPAADIAQSQQSPAMVQSAQPQAAVPALDIAALVVGITADKTGYPEDMLDRQADLEADLGIDSIKRVEIVGAIQKALPEASATAMQSELERYTRAKSLQQLIELLDELGAHAAPVVAPSVASTPATTTALPSVDIPALVLSITADKTGYPEDMLDLDADLEADLGIDSIKRVEIVGAIQKALPEASATAMQSELERYTRAKSLQQLIAAILELSAHAAPASAPAASAPAVTSVATPSVDVRALVLSITADKTGYPEDMLDLDADLEADLGIDSIKRVEIVGAIQKALPEASATAMQSELERYTRAKSLQALIAAIEAVGTPSPDDPGPVPGSRADVGSRNAKAVPASISEPAPRQVIQMQACAAAAADAPLTGEVLVIGADGALRAALEASSTKRLHFIDATDDAPAALAALSNWEAVLYLPALFAEDEKTARSLLQSWLQLAQAIGTPVTQRRLLLATRFGGDFARKEDGVTHPVAGGLVGGMLCLDQEQPNLVCRVVDFNGHDSAMMAELLLAEVATTSDPVEIGYAGRQRQHVVTTTELLPQTGEVPAPGQVVMATGGARGITLACLQEFVRRQPDTQLILLGRSAPATVEDLQGDATQIRQQLIQQARDSGDKLTPREMDAKISRAIAAQEVAAGIAALEKAGATVEYHAIDARDAKAMTALIADIRNRYGRLDGVLHAAGVIEDKLIADKTVESFQRVVGTKVDALSALNPLLADQPPSWMALFTSVAGRYGNRGQSDYACANEALTRWAWVLDRAWQGCRVRAFNWGPWDAGMASDAVREQFRERGIIPIPLKTGAAAFVDEIVASDASAVELVFGAGPWTRSAPDVETPARSGQAFVTDSLDVGPGGALVHKHRLTVARERFLNDHRLDGLAVLPAAGAAEWLAEVAAAGWPDWKVREVADLEVLSGVSLDGDCQDLVVKARASSHSGPGEQWASMDLAAADNPRSLYRARVRLGMDDETAPPAPARLLDGESMVASEAYAKLLFHGPLFQLVSSIDAINEQGLDATLRSSQVCDWIDGAQGDWIFDPGVIDCAPQLAIVWSRHQQDATALPSRFGRLTRFGSGPLPAALELRLRVTESSATQLKYDAWVLDAKTQQVRLHMADFSGTVSSALNRLAGQGV